MDINRSRLIVVFAVLACGFPQAALAQKVVVTYFSQSGHTKAMAEAVAKGARGVAGAEVRLLEIDKTTADDLRWADAIVVGSPVQFSNAPVPVLQAIAKWPFTGLRDRVGAAFVTGGWISGGQELTEVHLLATLLEFGLIIVGGEGSTPFGASAITGDPAIDSPKEGATVDARFLAKGEALGKRVAERARWLVAGRPKARAADTADSPSARRRRHPQVACTQVACLG